MLYRAKTDKDEGIRKCKIVGNGDIFGYELVNTYFVDSSGFGADDEPALTFNKFLDKVKVGYFYGIREAGQFQVYIGEYKKLTKSEIKQKDPNILNSKKINKSCRVTNYINGDKTITLYSTDILQFKGDKIILNSGGYKTITTKSRINQFLPGGIRVYQKNGEWFIDNGAYHFKFFDGIELTKEGIENEPEHLKIPGKVVKDIIKDIN